MGNKLASAVVMALIGGALLPASIIFFVSFLTGLIMAGRGIVSMVGEIELPEYIEDMVFYVLGLIGLVSGAIYGWAKQGRADRN